MRPTSKKLSLVKLRLMILKRRAGTLLDETDQCGCVLQDVLPVL
jgi:hypothetical protein